MKNYPILVTLLFVLIGCEPTKQPLYFIAPPLKDVQVKAHQVTIDPTIKQVARFTNGASVELPANAFVDEQGNAITGEVTLSMKTYGTAAEIMASGIPMQYAKDGKASTFESAGMFELSAQSGNASVKIKDGQNLTVNLPSKVSGDYDFFFFDQSNSDSANGGNWVKVSPDKPASNEALAPLKTFDLQFAEEEYPGLSPLLNVEWKLASNFSDPTMEPNRWVLNEKWTALDISKPQYGFGEKIINDRVKYRWMSEDNLFISKDKNRIITHHAPNIHIWDKSGKLINTITQVKDSYHPFKVLHEQFLIVEKPEGIAVYDWNGNLLCQLEKSYQHYILKDHGRIVYTEYGINRPVILSDLQGNKLKELPLPQDTRPYDEWRIYEKFLVTPEEEIMTNAKGGITIYDADGNKTQHRSGDHHDIQLLEQHKLLIQNLNGTLTVWDYKTDKDFTSGLKDFNFRDEEKKLFYGIYDITAIPKTTSLIINNSRGTPSLIWDYKMGTTTKLNFYVDPHLPDSNHTPLIVGYNRSESSYHLFDLKQKKEVVRLGSVHYGNSEILGPVPFYSKDKTHLLINSISHVQLRRIDGELITDLKRYDSLIVLAGFVGKDSIFSLSEDGIYRLWDMDGNELSSKVLTTNHFHYSTLFHGKILLWNWVFRSIQCYDLYGNLYIHNGRQFLHDELDTQLALLGKDSSCIVQHLFTRPDAMYQLNLWNKEKEFITYIYLDEDDLAHINRYMTYRGEQEQQEIERLLAKARREKARQEAESNFLRRFEVQQFGIYNWDVFAKQEDQITFNATFDFGMPVENNLITVFLITAINGPAVVKYPPSTWGKFAVNPKFPNQLVAVLPGNKVARFDQKAFEAINFEEVAQKKTFTFKMQVADEAVSSMDNLSALIN